MPKYRRPVRRVFYCTLCGHGEDSTRHSVAYKALKDKCTACGGTLVKKGELPEGVVPTEPVELPRRRRRRS